MVKTDARERLFAALERRKCWAIWTPIVYVANIYVRLLPVKKN
jgi:hypothetical protein